MFLYPSDNFISGSEYSLFLTGNTSSLFGNVKPQNYYTLESSLKYGFTDQINGSLGVGYNSGSGFHQFSVSDLASRYNKIEPYFYYDFGGDVRLTDNSRFNFDIHFVPFYKTFTTVDINPEMFEGKTEYINASFSFQLLF